MMKRAGWICMLFFFATFCRAADRTTFWTPNFKGQVREWQLEGDSAITGGDNCAVMESNLDCDGLAWCEKLSPRPQLHFLCGDLTNKKSHVASLGRWSASVTISSRFITNMGGYGQFLYVQEVDWDGRAPKEPSSLLRCKGTKFEKVLTLDTSETFAAADIAVDSQGRAWVLVGPDDYNDSTQIQMRCYSPEGKQLYAIPVKGISAMHAYGLMLINGTFYIAFGGMNKQFPNRLVALQYAKRQLKPGRTIAFESGGHDLASFYPGSPVIEGTDSSNQKN